MLPENSRLTGMVISRKLVPSSQASVAVTLTTWLPSAVNVVFRVPPVIVDPGGGGWPSIVNS